MSDNRFMMGFGLMRLPKLADETIDVEQVKLTDGDIKSFSIDQISRKIAPKLVPFISSCLRGRVFLKNSFDICRTGGRKRDHVHLIDLLVDTVGDGCTGILQMIDGAAAYGVVLNRGKYDRSKKQKQE